MRNVPKTARMKATLFLLRNCDDADAVPWPPPTRIPMLVAPEEFQKYSLTFLAIEIAVGMRATGKRCSEVRRSWKKWKLKN